MRKWLVAMLAAALVPVHATAEDRSWRFKVWLGEREIGYHEFVLQRQSGRLQLRSEATFEYRMLFVTLYEYEHENLETWEDDCLRRIEARTDANGKRYEVSGAQENGRFVWQSGSVERSLPGCLMTFAYWNPEFLRQDRLLNAQNGELVEVEVSEPRRDRLTVRGSERAAYRYRLKAGELDIDLWYSEDDEWLALETEARGGRRLRYELL